MQNSKVILLKALLIAGVIGLILMLSSISIVIKTLLLAGAFGLAGIYLPRPGKSKLSACAAVFAGAPGLVTLILFYTLAIHMYLSLGDWPGTIGTRGFSFELKSHADLALFCFGLMWRGIFLLPYVVLLFLTLGLFSRKYRAWLFYPAIFALPGVVCFLAIAIAPSGFSRWWWD